MVPAGASAVPQTPPPAAGDLAPALADATLVAARAALAEATATAASLDARVLRLRELLETSGRRLAARQAGQAEQGALAGSLRAQLAERHRQLDVHQQGVAARELRIRLSRQTLLETSHKLEALRARGGVAEEALRAKSVQLGVLTERLRERRLQKLELQRLELVQRVRVGPERWRPPTRCDEALAAWRAAAAARRVNLERLRGGVLLWRAAALHAAMVAWREAGAARAHDGRVVEQRRRRALRALEASAEANVFARSPELERLARKDK